MSRFDGWQYGRTTGVAKSYPCKMKPINTKNVCAGLGIYLIFHSPATFADHPTVAFGTEGIGAINTISAKPLPLDSWVIGLRTEVINNDAFSTEQRDA
jgi:hypothetical protein